MRGHLVQPSSNAFGLFLALLFSKLLATGCSSSVFEHAVVHLLLKKAELDDNQLKNYRPVSNLPLFSKLL